MRTIRHSQKKQESLLARAIAVIALAAALTGCTLFSSAQPVRVSMFANQIKQIAKVNKIPLAEAAHEVKAAGVTGFDVNHDNPIIPEMIAAGLVPCNFYGFPKFLSADNGKKDCDAFVANAVKWGAPRIMCVPDSFSGKADEEAEFQKMLAGMRYLVAQAKAAGVVVTVEDFGGVKNPCSQTKYLKRFLEEIPDLGFALDSGNLYYAGRGESIVEMAAFAQKLGRIRHVHLKDQTAADNHAYASLGTGAVSNAQVIKFVHANGYDGWWTLENIVGPDLIGDVRKQHAALLSMMK